MPRIRWVNLCLSILISTSSFAQHLTSYRHVGSGLSITDQMQLLDVRRVLYGDRYAEIQGTPYLTETFDSANVHTDKGVFFGVPMRYNIYEDYLEFKIALKDCPLPAFTITKREHQATKNYRRRRVN